MIAAQNYVAACCEMGGEWVHYCSMSERVKYFYVELSKREELDRAWSICKDMQDGGVQERGRATEVRSCHI